jgi:hypothetical protein
LLVSLVDALALEIFLWKLSMQQSFANANVVSENNETIEIYIYDGIMEENVSVQTKTNKDP